MKLFSQILSLKSGVLFFALIAFCASCASDYNTVDPKLNIQKMMGKWRVNNAEEFEEWYPSDGYPFKGAVYSGEGAKKETITIEKVGTEIIYKAKVFDQNGGKTIGFKMINCNENEITFQNKEHDFPNTISYRFKNTNNIEALVSGARDQQPIEMTLKFERVQ